MTTRQYGWALPLGLSILAWALLVGGAILLGRLT